MRFTFLNRSVALGLLLWICISSVSANGVASKRVVRKYGTAQLTMNWQEPIGNSSFAKYCQQQIRKKLGAIELEAAKELRTAGSATEDQNPSYTIDVDLKATYSSDAIFSIGGSHHTWPGSASLSASYPLSWTWGLENGRTKAISIADLFRADTEWRDAIQLRLADAIEPMLKKQSLKEGGDRYAEAALNGHWNITKSGLVWRVMDMDRSKWMFSPALSWEVLSPLLKPAGPLREHIVKSSHNPNVALLFPQKEQIPLSLLPLKFTSQVLDCSELPKLDAFVRFSMGEPRGKRATLLTYEGSQLREYMVEGSRLQKGELRTVSTPRKWLASPAGQLITLPGRTFELKLLHRDGKYRKVLSAPIVGYEPAIVLDRPNSTFYLTAQKMGSPDYQMDVGLATFRWKNGEFVQVSFQDYKSLGVHGWLTTIPLDMDGDGLDELLAQSENGESVDSVFTLHWTGRAFQRDWSYTMTEKNLVSISYAGNVARSHNNLVIAFGTSEVGSNYPVGDTWLMEYRNRKLEKIVELKGMPIAVGDFDGDGDRDIISIVTDSLGSGGSPYLMLHQQEG